MPPPDPASLPPLTDAEADALRLAAEAVPEKEWTYGWDGVAGVFFIPEARASILSPHGVSFDREEDARHASLANPAAVLRLLADRERLVVENERLRADRDEWKEAALHWQKKAGG